MIVKPTVNELLKHAENRFALVIATSRRARQIAKDKELLDRSGESSPVTIAANEIAESKVEIYEEEKVEKEEIEEHENNE